MSRRRSKLPADPQRKRSFWAKFVFIVSVIAAIVWVVNFITGTVQPFVFEAAHQVGEWIKTFALLGALQDQVDQLQQRVDQLEQRIEQCSPPPKSKPQPPQPQPPPPPPDASQSILHSAIQLAVGAVFLLVAMFILHRLG